MLVLYVHPNTRNECPGLCAHLGTACCDCSLSMQPEECMQLQRSPVMLGLEQACSALPQHQGCWHVADRCHA